MSRAQLKRIKNALSLAAPDQIGMVSADARTTAEGLSRTLGLPPFEFFVPDYRDRVYKGQKGDFRLLIGVSSLGILQMEVIEPLEGTSIHSDFLAATGGGLHHLGFLVDDLAACLNAYALRGVGVLQSGGRPGVTWAYLDSVGKTGLLIELIQRS